MDFILRVLGFKSADLENDEAEYYERLHRDYVSMASTARELGDVNGERVAWAEAFKSQAMANNARPRQDLRQVFDAVDTHEREQAVRAEMQERFLARFSPEK